jgi:alpha-L-fucosidase
LDPRLLYGINLREYIGLDDFMYRPEQGIFVNHLDYAKWYATRWALRIEDVIEKYDPDFFYTDGDDKQPFSGYKTGTGYKCDAAQRVIASYYNRTLKTRGKVDTFSIIKFHPPANGIVTTVESHYPPGIKTDQPWIGENAVGDWFYRPGIVYSSTALIRYLLECVSRDGCYAVNIPIEPDGSLDPACVTMLHEVGAWMKVNGEGIYGSKAWVTLGEGENGVIKNLPDKALSDRQANFPFGSKDFRFTVGKDGAIYAFCLTVPAPGTELKITSLGSQGNRLKTPVKSVSLLGSNASLNWSQGADALRITCPAAMPFQTAVAFRIR